MDLLRVPTRLGFPLLGGSKLGVHIPAQPDLLGEVVPFHLLLAEEPRRGTEKKTSVKNTKIHEERRKREGRSSGYLASGNDDVTQDAPGLV